MKFNKFFFLVAALVIVLDQLTKFIADRFFYTVHNTGAAFGLFQNMTLILIVISIIVIGIILYYYKSLTKASLTVYTGLILGGTISNLIDRIFLGYVIDFINFRIWPAFNLADLAITIGVIGLIIYLIQKK